jgi:polyisoprenoid-binding protein YceI
MRRHLSMIAMLAVLVTMARPVAAEVTRWEIVPGDGSRVEFESKAPLESFTGRTKQVSGGCAFDTDRLVGEVTLEVKVEMASFDTGLGKRNQHMRDKHLETDRFPRSWLRGGTIKASSAARLPVGGAVSVEFVGELELHGVRRPVVCTIKLLRPTADALAATAEFPVKLADYGIKRPQVLMMKLADEQHVRVDLVLGRNP